MLATQKIGIVAQVINERPDCNKFRAYDIFKTI